MNYSNYINVKPEVKLIYDCLVNKSNIVLKFSIENCYPCLMLKNIFNNFVTNKHYLLLKNNIFIINILINREIENKELDKMLNDFNIKAFPTTIFIKKKKNSVDFINNIIDKKVGFYNNDILLEQIKKFI